MESAERLFELLKAAVVRLKGSKLGDHMGRVIVETAPRTVLA
jgi:hypothetical protein